MNSPFGIFDIQHKDGKLYLNGIEVDCAGFYKYISDKKEENEMISAEEAKGRL